MLNTNALERASILMIDDNPGDIMLVKSFLEEVAPSAEITACTDAQSGLNHLSKGNFDLCLLDYFIGGETGLEVLYSTQGAQTACPVILLTGVDDLDLDLQVMAAGAIDHINKRDLSPRLLARSLRYALSHSRTLAALRQSKVHLERIALHDMLTGLGNRALFMDRLEHAFKLQQRSRARLAVLFIDLDGFKPINDCHGHTTGDLALKEVAARLVSTLRASDTVARLGGDEFTVLIEDVTEEKDILLLAERLREQIELPVTLGSLPPFHLSASIGVAFSNADTQTHEDLLRCADVAMYHAKKKALSGIEIFDARMQRGLLERLHLEKDLKSALGRDELELYYQPIVSLPSGNVYGFEALLRWRRNGELLTPNAFLEAAEACGEIVPISTWTLKQACLWCASINQTTKQGVTVAVNVSPQQFYHPHFVRSVQLALHQADLEPRLLHLELTENIIMHDQTKSVRKLRKLRGLGVAIHLDDFGTGCSSLSHLLYLPVDAIKVDRSFIQSLPEPRSDAIVSALLLIADRLGLEVIAEGIEERTQLEYVQQLGSHLGQGYLFSRPSSAEQCRMMVGQSFVTETPGINADIACSGPS